MSYTFLDVAHTFSQAGRPYIAVTSGRPVYKEAVNAPVTQFHFDQHCGYTSLSLSPAVHHSNMPRPIVKSRKSTQPRKVPVPVPEDNIESQDVEVIVTPDLHVREPELPDFGDNAQPDLELTQMDEPEPAQSTSTASTSAFVQPPRRGKKKTTRLTHGDIPQYSFTDDQVDIIRNFIQANYALYHKTDREYSNHKIKTDLWHKCADLFKEGGGPTWLQCRKLFEQKRTAFGKLESQEMRSGSARTTPTPREAALKEEWGFLKGHITHFKTRSSQSFHSDIEHDSASSGNESAASILSAHSLVRRQERRKKNRPSTSSQEPGSSHGDPDAEQNEVDLPPRVRTLINRVQTMTQGNQEPWATTNVYHFSKMIAQQVYELPPQERHDVMHGAMSFVLGKLRKIQQRDVECQTPPLQAVNPGQPTIQHGQTLPQPQIIQGATPLYSAPVQYAPPHTPGGWLPPAPVAPIYYQQLPPTSTPYQPASTTLTHSTGTYHIMQPSQQPSTSGFVPTTTSYPTITSQQPSTSGFVPTTTSYPTITTSASVTSSPSSLFETFRDVYTTTSSSMHTPQVSGAEDATDN